MKNTTSPWVERQRRTNRLVRLAARYLIQNDELTPKCILTLCHLTWITVADDDDNTSYIKSLKIPALKTIFQGKNYEELNLPQIAADIASRTTVSDLDRQSIVQHTGFTNFRRPYRPSALQWIERHARLLRTLIVKAFDMSADDDGLSIVRRIAHLDRIPTPSATQHTACQNLLTPLFFALDPRLRFPIINGATRVREILTILGVQDESLPSKYQSLLQIYSYADIADAAELDQVEINTLQDLISEEESFATNREALSLQDEHDVLAVQRLGTYRSRRIHNRMTNKLFREFSKWFTVVPGGAPEPLFDLMIKEYVLGRDLLIEVKGSADTPSVRLAIGQLFHYRHQLRTPNKADLAIVLPERPEPSLPLLLKELKIGLIWQEGERFITDTDFLQPLMRRVT